MKLYDAKNIRNVVLAGHGGVGKTSLVEAFAYKTKVTDRLGKIQDGNTVSDFEPEETKRQISVSLSLIPIEYDGLKINLLDSPGYFDFVGEVKSAMIAADSALIVMDVVSGPQAGTEKTFYYAEAHNLPTAFVVNKMDRENVNIVETIQSIQQKFSEKCHPIFFPYIKNDELQGVADIVHKKYKTKDGKEAAIPEDILSTIDDYHDALTESVIEVDDAIVEKYLGGEEISQTEFLSCLKKSFQKRLIFPILFTAATESQGTDDLLQFVSTYMPSPEDKGSVTAIKEDGSKTDLPVDKNGPLAALVFKTMTDPYVGRISLVKVFSGDLNADSKIFNTAEEKSDKIGQIATFIGKKEVPIDHIPAGDIGAITKLNLTKTGHTLAQSDQMVTVPWIKLPIPNARMSIKAEKKSDEDKLGAVLPKMQEDDISILIERDHDTGEIIIRGMGDNHLQVTIEKAKRKFGVSFLLEQPKIAYKETIRKPIKVEGKHKKQSGGHGQFGHCWLEVQPSKRGEYFEFENKIFGGAIPKTYVPAVEKGVLEAMQHGLLAGYPVVDLKVTVYDGSYHPVDSSEQAFKMAGSIALKKALDQGESILLEPIMDLRVHVPEDSMGSVIDDLNTRRGRIMSMKVDDQKGWQIIEAQAPLGELGNYITTIKSVSGARGFYEMEFSHYEEAPPKTVQKVIEEAKEEEAS
ncbi:MAG: elongation factor G [Caldisericia bacterium]|nr:elongation factor G [Caldisericia bacterium]MDD4614845.1 elongation factor G [Caldisericia bacterium]